MSTKEIRQAALDKFIADNHQEGDTIPHAYFWKLFGRTEPHGHMHAGVFKKAYLAHAGDIEWLRNKLLDAHMDMQNVRAEGYTLLRWTERVAIVTTDAKTELGKILRRNVKRLESIPNVHLLNGDQQRRHDASMLMLQHINSIRRNKNRFGDAA